MKGGYLKGGREEWRWNKRREREREHGMENANARGGKLVGD